MKKKHRSTAFDIMYRYGMSFFDENSNMESVSFKLYEADAKSFLPIIEASGITYEISELHGFRALLGFLKFRAGICLGAVLFFVWMMYSSRLIWDVRISGAEKTDVGEIKALLEELGCGVGDYYPGIDFNHLHAQYAALQHDIAWLSVYMNGAVAEVQVRELWADTRPKHDENTYANIVAAQDGIVEEVNVFEGQASVKAGDVVRKGQVLISGVVENKDGSVRLEYASGEVICRTAVPINVEISTQKEIKVYTGREKVQNYVKFFKKTINFFGKSGIDYISYDKIDTMEQLCPFGLCKIPVWIYKTVAKEYVTKSVTLSTDEAVEEAMTALSNRIKEETEDAELVSRAVDVSVYEGKCTVNCLLYVRRDISETSEFVASDGASE